MKKEIAPLSSEHFRYFIELRPQVNEILSPHDEIELRHEMATGFVTTLKEWLKENELQMKVSWLSITAFGQVQITCEISLINMIQECDVMSIAAIRYGTLLLGEGLNKFNEIGAR